MICMYVSSETLIWSSGESPNGCTKPSHGWGWVGRYRAKSWSVGTVKFHSERNIAVSPHTPSPRSSTPVSFQWPCFS